MKGLFTVVAASMLLATGFLASEVYAGQEGRCRACHAFDDSNKMGPGLKAIFGRKAGTHPGFAYSDSVKNGNWVWDEDHLRKWIENAPEAIKEFTGDANATTKMPKYNIKGAKADELIEFLKGLQ